LIFWTSADGPKVNPTDFFIGSADDFVAMHYQGIDAGTGVFESSSG
jgi:hypothetical protein